MRTLMRSVFLRRTSFAVVLLAAFPGEPTLAQAQQAAETIVSGTVLDLNGQPIAGVLIGYKTPEELRAEREKRVRSAPPGQGVYGRMSEEQKREEIEEQSRIRPSTQGIFYSGGNVVGKTDDSGAFRVEVPGGGTYIITAEKSGFTRSSMQPVLIETGKTLELGQPIVLRGLPPPAGPGPRRPGDGPGGPGRGRGIPPAIGSN